MASFAQEYSGGLTVSVIGHALIVLIFSFNLISMPFKDVPPVQLAIEATVIDMGAVRKKQAAEQQRQLELERQKQAAETERRKKIETQKQQKLNEQKRQQELKQKKIAEQKRKKEAEQKRIAEQKRKTEEARKAELKRKAEAAERLRQQEMQRQFQSEIEAEEQRLAAISSGKLQQYIAAISSRVTRNWVRPASAKAGIECEVHVTQIPGGEIINVRVGSCNGDAAVVRSIEAAFYRASPLPPPSDPSLFERNLRFRFRPEE
ncbi:MAG: hypothetical protein CL797_09410 [Chromatiales bacterium]|nr:hypothetical protein [Chromatiales bacterium]